MSIRGQDYEANETMVMAVDVFEGAAKNDFDSAVHILNTRGDGPYKLLREHMDAWAATWSRGNIEVRSRQQGSRENREFKLEYLVALCRALLHPQLIRTSLGEKNCFFLKMKVTGT